MQFSAQQIAAAIGGTIYGDASASVFDVASIETATQGRLSYVCDTKYLPLLATTQASIVLVNADLLPSSPQSSATIIAVDNARVAMASLLAMVAEVMYPRKKGIEQPSFVSDGVSLPDDVYVGAFAYIGKNVQIGKGVQIYPQVYVGDNVRIGDNTILYAGAKVYANTQIGKDCIIHAGVVLGSDGFGFEPDAEQINRKVPQIGVVVIEDDVEIGANTTVDRAMMGATIVRRNAKIDNLVQVAHNVEVGASTFLCSQVGIAGSSTIGHHCTLAGQVGVAGHISIADHCVFGAQSGIPNHVRKSGIYMGTPAIDASNWRRSVVGFKQLPDIIRDLNQKK